MKIIDISDKFNDNSIRIKKKIVFHWTGGSTAKGAIDWLNKRSGGKGSVGYNYIIDKDGSIYMLADPRTRWMHNTGLGTKYDEDTIPIALASKDENDRFTDRQVMASKSLVEKLDKWFWITETTHHAALNSKKVDFPEYIWAEFAQQVLIFLK